MLELRKVDFKNSDLEVVVIPVSLATSLHSDFTIVSLIKKAENLADFFGEKGKRVVLYSPSDVSIRKVVFLGLGELEKVDFETLRLFAGKAINDCIECGISHVIYAMPLSDKFNMDAEDMFRSVMEGIFLAGHSYDDYKKDKNLFSLDKVTLAISNENQFNLVSLISKTDSVCKSTVLARKWVNMPSNDKKPTQFAKLIKNSFIKTDIKVNIFDQKWLNANKFHAMLAVAQGSANEPCLVTMEYNPDKFQKTILLVGKGVTFDSGGINLKPSSGLEKMKTDMAGSAAVVGTLIALASMKISNRVIGVVPLVENMPSGKAICPGDIVKTFSGKSVEINNTDAEGRLTLVDAMAWGIEKYKPDVVIDIATLTGACVVALGEEIAGFFSKDDYLSDLVFQSGQKTFERCWQLPVPSDYLSLLKSDLADLSNVSNSKWGGAITAALFLSEFVGEMPWVHIDIAGPAFLKKKTDYCPVGATGFGVRLLCEIILNL